ncbi:hypothetical protein B0F90DRAFT_1665833 [Multifurca ochricompacta]|uniref:Cyclin-D1-binding protein 1-like N-terminal domain-containing protein n=1 Tax=Multifurca ochricompacta TaxID=376703 RepID=A0AAD4MA37_9AGAM|nr:hypothetical protein B0F90DRAFT_1665833 [Multifurca ochricompacta]
MSSSSTTTADTCTNSINSIKIKTNTISNLNKTQLSTLRFDFISLLSVLYSNTTKLSIALNPSNPTYSAAITPLKDLIIHSSTLASNASYFLPNVHGRALTAEVHSTAKSILTALQDLVHAHHSLLISLANNDGDSVPEKETYLSKTAIVHELITQAKADQPQGLSTSNLIAVRKRWREHSDIIADAEKMLEIEAFPSDHPDDDGFDDGWGDPELDLGGSDKQSPEQIELAKRILVVVQRTSALFNDICSTLLLPLRSSGQASPPNVLFDDLLDSAPPLVAAVDELATQIYDTPDVPSHLDEGRDGFARALTAVISAVEAIGKGREDSRPSSEMGSKAYFIEQFTRLNVAVQSVQWAILE